MKNNRWNDTKVDTGLYLLLQDLSGVLTDREDFQFAYKYGSVVDLDRKVITGSRLWDVVSPVIRKSGYKTDVFLRALGNIHASNIPVLQDFAASMVSSSLSKFGFQMVTLLEDIRLEEIIRKERPGTKHDFQIRTEAL